MGPGAIESRVTCDLIKEAGYTHNLAWPVDDQPIWMRTRAGKILCVPYPMEFNDIGINVHRDHTGQEFADLSDAEKRALALADNKITENAGWDRPALAAELADLTRILPE
jgi:hypothetical protein